MASNLSNQYETLANGELWINFLVLAAAYVVTRGVETFAEGMTDFDIPNELYGVITILGANGWLAGDYRQYAMAGGGIYVLDEVGKRFEIKDELEERFGGE